MSAEQILMMALALGGGGLVKGATGMGLPIVALPILATFLNVPHAVAVVCIVAIFTNAWQAWHFRADQEASGFFLPRLVVAGAVGAAIGTWLLTSLPERALSLVLGLLLVAYIALRLANPRFVLPHHAGRRFAWPVGLSAGTLTGATGIGSPIGVTFIDSLRLHRGAHIFAVSAMFLLFSIVQIAVLIAAGIVTGPVLLQGIVGIVPALALMPVGSFLAARLSQKAFGVMVLAVLAVVAATLIDKGIRWIA